MVFPVSATQQLVKGIIFLIVVALTIDRKSLRVILNNWLEECMDTFKEYEFWFVVVPSMVPRPLSRLLFTLGR